MEGNTIKKAGGLLIRDRKVMLERHGGNDTYIIPGGKLEKGETPQQALVRELKEEFQIIVSEHDLEPMGTFTSQAVHNPTSIVLIETFLVKKWKGDIILDGGIEDVAWINSNSSKDIAVSTITTKDIIPLLLDKGLID